MGKLLRRNAAVAAFFLFAILLAAALLIGSTMADSLTGVQVLADRREEYVPLVFEEHQDSTVLVCSGEDHGVLLRLDKETGEVLESRETNFLSLWAALRDNLLFVLEYGEQGVFLATYDSESLTEVSRRPLPFHPDRLLQFDCDGIGTVYCTLSDSPALLRTLSPEGTEETQEFHGVIEYLEAAEDGSLLVFSDEKLFCGEQEIPCLAMPCKRLSSTILIDQDGVVSELTTDEAGLFLSPLFRCSEPLTDAFSFCLDRENCLVLSNGSTVLRYDMAGKNRGSCHLSSVPLAVCSSGALLRERDGLSYCAFVFSKENPPSELLPPESSKPPEETPPEEPPFEVEGLYILMQAGSTAAELREYFKPEAVKIRDLTGRQITQGTLGTGMTAGDWIIVIEGDCNGTGTVNSADLRTALSLFLDSPLVSDANSRAADLNRSGDIDTNDLLMLSARLSK